MPESAFRMKNENIFRLRDSTLFDGVAVAMICVAFMFNSNLN